MSVAAEELKTLTTSQVVDARGVSCPGPVIAAKKAIGGVPVGGVMEIQATDSGTLKDIPAWCRKLGHEYLGAVEDGGHLRLFLKKLK